MPDGPLVLTRAIRVQRDLAGADIDSVIGGALALAYHVDDPRATQDIDLNVAVQSTRATELLTALPSDIVWDDRTLGQIERDDQVRLEWPVPGEVSMPLDVFFIADPFHEGLFDRAITVPMLDATVRVLSANDLAIFKTLFDRPKDWPDIIAMRDAHDSTLDLTVVARVVAHIVGKNDHRIARLAELAEGDD